MRYLSLFSGIGGFDLGFDRAGMTCAGQVEIDEFCRRVLAKHWPDVKRMADIREVKGDEFGTIDLICGGFPCQPHSLAGKRKGAADDRNLWPEYLRLIDAIRPTWVVGENVPGIRSTILDEVLSDLDGFGYTTATISVPACAFDAPHYRERYFILAHTSGNRRDKMEQQNSGGKKVKRALYSIAERGGLGEWWEPEPGVGRVAYGIPDRVDRLKSLGNAVVPQVAEWLGRHIVELER